MNDRDEAHLLETLAAAFRAVGNDILAKTPADMPLIAMAMGLAATQLMFSAAENTEQALGSAEIFAHASLRSMADMVSGMDAHQVTQ